MVAMLKKTLLLLSLPLILVGCREVTYETSQVTGVVSYKDYRHAWSQPVSTGKITTFIYHPPRYEVGIRYEGVESVFNDKYLYNSLNIGDEMQVNLVRKMDAETGKQLKSYLELIK